MSMKKFFYKAKLGPDQLVDGVIEALTEEKAVEVLSRKGYVVTLMKELRGDNKDKTEHEKTKRGIGYRKKILIFFTRQLSVLLRSGIPLIRGLDIISSQISDPNLRRVIEDLSRRIKKGETLSEGMAVYPKIFSDFYLAMVRAGEESGTIDKSLDRLAEYYKKQNRLMAKVRSAMAYPVFIAVVGMFTVFFVFTNVMPRIIPVLLSLNTELPLPTRALIFISELFKEKSGWLALGGLIFILMFTKAMSKDVFKNYVSAFKLNIPIFGELILKNELSRLTRTMEICLRSGIPAVKATEIALTMLGENYLKKRLEGSVKSIERGRSLTLTFSESGVFPGFAISLINVGEESGDLAGSMENVSSAFEMDCEDAIDIAVGLLEPLMVLVVGLIVGFIVSAVLLPVFQMNFVQI